MYLAPSSVFRSTNAVAEDGTLYCLSIWRVRWTVRISSWMLWIFPTTTPRIRTSEPGVSSWLALGRSSERVYVGRNPP